MKWEDIKKIQVGNFFQINESTGTSACLIAHYGNFFPNTHSANLEIHVEKHHKIEYAFLVKEKEEIKSNKRKNKKERGRLVKKIHISIKRQLLMDAYVDLVENNGRLKNLWRIVGFVLLSSPLLLV